MNKPKKRYFVRENVIVVEFRPSTTVTQVCPYCNSTSNWTIHRLLCDKNIDTAMRIVEPTSKDAG